MLLLAHSIKVGWLCPLLVHSREGGGGGHKRVDQTISITGSPLFPVASCLGCAREKCPSAKGSQVIVVWLPLNLFYLFFSAVYTYIQSRFYRSPKVILGKLRERLRLYASFSFK